MPHRMVTRWRAQVRPMVRASVGSGWVAMGMPSTRGIRVVMVRPKAWKSGSAERITSSRSGLSTALVWRRFPTMLAWESSTPLGMPSEPELKRMAAVSSRWTLRSDTSSSHQEGRNLARRSWRRNWGLEMDSRRSSIRTTWATWERVERSNPREASLVSNWREVITVRTPARPMHRARTSGDWV